MSQVIRKYVIKQSVVLPSNSKIVHVAHQGDVPVMWCQHSNREDSRAPVEVRYFEVFATGQSVAQGVYLATWVEADSNFEWHLFEVPPMTAAVRGEVRGPVADEDGCCSSCGRGLAPCPACQAVPGE